MSEYYSEVENYEKSTTMAKAAIQIYAKKNRIPNIEKLAYEVAFNNWKLGMSIEENSTMINHCQAFAEFNNDTTVLRYLKYLRENHKFFEPDLTDKSGNNTRL